MGRWFPVRVSGESMLPTLSPGDLLAVRAARAGEPRAGQIVVAREGELELVKRVASVRADGTVVLTGDNRGGSTDREVAATAIAGVVRARYWPPLRVRLLGG